MKSPFKFLDSFKREDADSFFGREKEVEELYDKVNRGRMLLIYGQSGTGKTSLIQCGLANRFDPTDWFPISIRRRDDINESLDQELSKYTEEGLDGDLQEKIEDIYETYLRPIYLIFDQFEELFILGGPDEQYRFVNDIRQVIAASLPCRILFVIREEYLGYLYDLEPQLPTLFDWRLRVERMNNEKVKEVISKSLDRFNVVLEKPEDNLQQILTNLTPKKEGVHLPYLQVYLDMLYREDFQRTYPEVAPDEKYPPLEFTSDEIKDFGEIGGVLDRFLQEQEGEMEIIFEEKGWENLATGTVRKILDGFVTEEGTKRPVEYALQDDHMAVTESALRYFPPMETEQLSFILKELERRRILRAEDQAVELSHDILAESIDDNRTSEQRLLNEVKRRLQYAYELHRNDGIYLTEKQLASIEEYLPELVLEDEVRQFVEDSRAEIKRQAEEKERLRKEELERERAQAEKERKLRQDAEGAKEEAERERDRAEAALSEAEAARKRENEALQRQLETEKKASERQRFFVRVIGAAALVAVALGIWAGTSNVKLLTERERSTQERFERRLEKGNIFFRNSDYENAVAEFREALREDSAYTRKDLISRGGLRPDSIIRLIAEAGLKDTLKTEYDRLLAEGEEKEDEEKYLEALLLYEEARELEESGNLGENLDQEINQKVVSMRNRLESVYKEHIRVAKVLQNKGGDNRWASKLVEKLDSIKVMDSKYGREDRLRKVIMESENDLDDLKAYGSR